jgi:membrane associated rhomboid family serine protease
MKEKEEDLTEGHREKEHEQLRREAEGFTAGPGVVASKTQARGSLAGVLIGVVVGAVLGIIIGVAVFDANRSVVITAVAVAIAGAVFGGVTGGFVGPRKKLEGTEADT